MELIDAYPFRKFISGKDLYTLEWLISDFMTEIEELARGKVEDLVAIGLYQVGANKVKEYIMTLYKRCEKYLKPIEDVREILAREVGEEFKSRSYRA